MTCIERLKQIQVDMEKMRWFPQYFENRYIFVNLAMSYFLLMDKSPEQIREYFASHHYEAWSGDFKQRIDPTTIDWSGIGKGAGSPNIFIRQLPHLGNALGALKFDLTNDFAIYLHDTNQRDLFDSAMRQLSSGCVRLEKPLDLAEYLLEETPWDRTRIASMMARPNEIIAKPTEITVPTNKRIPVYTVYLTSMMNSDKVIRFSEDLYGQNFRIAQSIGGLF